MSAWSGVSVCILCKFGIWACQPNYYQYECSTEYIAYLALIHTCSILGTIYRGYIQAVKWYSMYGNIYICSGGEPSVSSSWTSNLTRDRQNHLVPHFLVCANSINRAHYYWNWFPEDGTLLYVWVELEMIEVEQFVRKESVSSCRFWPCCRMNWCWLPII